MKNYDDNLDITEYYSDYKFIAANSKCENSGDKWISTDPLAVWEGTVNGCESNNQIIRSDFCSIGKKIEKKTAVQLSNHWR